MDEKEIDFKCVLIHPCLVNLKVGDKASSLVNEKLIEYRTESASGSAGSTRRIPPATSPYHSGIWKAMARAKATTADGQSPPLRTERHLDCPLPQATGSVQEAKCQQNYKMEEREN